MGVTENAANSPTMIRKRPHSKTRSGCLRCKARRIKCDETKPQCGHCQRHSALCEYPDLRKNSSTSERSASTTPVPRLQEEPNEDGELNMTDLQLMAHWIFVASSSFGFQPGDSLHWQRDVTQLACDFPFLMHGILAVSALSKSRSVPPSECQFWLWTAAHHQNKALPAYRQIIGEAEQYMNEQNCHAVMATGYLICVYAGFAVTSSGAYGTYGQGQCTIPELLEFFSLMRGARSIMSYKTQWAMNGPMAMYLRQWPSVIDVSLNPHDERIADLTAVFDRVESSPGEQIHSDADVYRTTLMLLREAFAVPFQPVDGVGWKLALMTWVERIPQRYLELLSDSKPEALLILGYFAVLPKRCALQDWYAEGAAERVLSMVCNSLGEQWSHWLAWPMEEIGANS